MVLLFYMKYKDFTKYFFCIVRVRPVIKLLHVYITINIKIMKDAFFEIANSYLYKYIFNY